MKILMDAMKPISRKKELSLNRRQVGRHQGAREVSRRLRQLEKGQIKVQS